MVGAYGTLIDPYIFTWRTSLALIIFAFLGTGLAFVYRERFQRITKSRLRTAFAIVALFAFFLLSIPLLLFGLFADVSTSTTHLVAIAGLVTSVGSVIGTASTMVLAWRSDGRAAKESELKLVQLQQQIKELELKLNSSTGTIEGPR